MTPGRLFHAFTGSLAAFMAGYLQPLDFVNAGLLAVALASAYYFSRDEPAEETQ